MLPNIPATNSPPTGKAWPEGIRRVLGSTRETTLVCRCLPNAELSERVIPVPATLSARRPARARTRNGLGRDGRLARRQRALRNGWHAHRGWPGLVAREPTTRSTLLIATDVRRPPCHLQPCRCAGRSPARAGAGFSRRGVPCARAQLLVNALTDTWSEIQAERLKAGGQQRLPKLEVLLARGTDRRGFSSRAAPLPR